MLCIVNNRCSQVHVGFWSRCFTDFQLCCAIDRFPNLPFETLHLFRSCLVDCGAKSKLLLSKISGAVSCAFGEGVRPASSQLNCLPSSEQRDLEHRTRGSELRRAVVPKHETAGQSCASLPHPEATAQASCFPSGPLRPGIAVRTSV